MRALVGPHDRFPCGAYLIQCKLIATAFFLHYITLFDHCWSWGQWFNIRNIWRTCTVGPASQQQHCLYMTSISIIRRTCTVRRASEHPLSCWSSGPRCRKPLRPVHGCLKVEKVTSGSQRHIYTTSFNIYIQFLSDPYFIKACLTWPDECRGVVGNPDNWKTSWKLLEPLNTLKCGSLVQETWAKKMSVMLYTVEILFQKKNYHLNVFMWHIVHWPSCNSSESHDHKSCKTSAAKWQIHDTNHVADR